MIAIPEVVNESGNVKINFPIATKANLEPYFVEAEHVIPLRTSGTLRMQTIKGIQELGRSTYKYSTKFEFEIDVIWHKWPKCGPKMDESLICENYPTY